MFPAPIVWAVWVRAELFAGIHWPPPGGRLDWPMIPACPKFVNSSITTIDCIPTGHAGDHII